VLGSEYHWARRLTSWLRMQLARFWLWWRAWRERRKAKKSAPAPEGVEADLVIDLPERPADEAERQAS
jgi:hypothetical protein